MAPRPVSGGSYAYNVAHQGAGEGSEWSMSSTGDQSSRSFGVRGASRQRLGRGDNADDDNRKSSFGSSNTGPNRFNCPVCMTDDNDPRLSYEGSWTLSRAFGSTMHSTWTAGSTISFRFNGSGIVVFGTVPRSNETVTPPTAVYLLDEKPFPTTQPRAGRAISDQPLFAASQLSNQEHQLIINITDANAPYTLDYVYVFPRFNFTMQHDVLPSSSSSMAQLPTSSGAVVPGALSGAKPNANVIRALAGVLGTVVTIIFIAVGYLIFRRYQRRAWNRHTPLEAPQPPETPQDTIFTSFTSTESILANNPSIMWSNSSPSEGRASVFSRGKSPPSPIPPPPLPPKHPTL